MDRSLSSGTSTWDQQTASAPAAAVIADPQWFPEDFDPASQTLSFVRCSVDMLAREPFLDPRWNRLALPRCKVELSALAAQLAADAEPPQVHFIWHTSYCGSTLLAQALNRPGCNLSLKEPLILVSTADAKRRELAGAGRAPPRLTDIVLRLLARSHRPGERVTLKPSNAANNLMADAARLTAGKALFLYSDLPSFLVSIAKGGVMLRRYARRLFGNIAADSGQPLRWPVAELFQMSDLEIAALAWHLQIAEFRRSFQAYGPARAACLDCEDLLAEPEGVLARIDRFFALGLGEAYLRAAAHSAREHDAKRPGHRFDPAHRRHQRQKIRGQLGDELERIVAWSYQMCPETPAGIPAPNPLLEVDER